MTAHAIITGEWPRCPDCLGVHAIGGWTEDPDGDPIPLGLVVDRAGDGVIGVWVCEWCEFEMPADVEWRP